MRESDAVKANACVSAARKALYSLAKESCSAADAAADEAKKEENWEELETADSERRSPAMDDSDDDDGHPLFIMLN